MIVVGQDVERAIALVDAVLAALFPRRDEQRRRLGIVGGEQIDLARLVIPGRDDDIIVRRGLRSEEHTSELQSLMRISYAVFCLKKNNSNICLFFSLRM